MTEDGLPCVCGCEELTPANRLFARGECRTRAELAASFFLAGTYRWAKPYVDKAVFPTGVVNPDVVSPEEWSELGRLERLRILIGTLDPVEVEAGRWSRWLAEKSLEQPTCPQQLWWPSLDVLLREHEGVRRTLILRECQDLLAIEQARPRELVEVVTDCFRYLQRKERKAKAEGADPVGNPTSYLVGAIKRELERRHAREAS